MSLRARSSFTKAASKTEKPRLARWWRERRRLPPHARGDEQGGHAEKRQRPRRHLDWRSLMPLVWRAVGSRTRRRFSTSTFLARVTTRRTSRSSTPASLFKPPKTGLARQSTWVLPSCAGQMAKLDRLTADSVAANLKGFPKEADLSEASVEEPIQVG